MPDIEGLGLPGRQRGGGLGCAGPDGESAALYRLYAMGDQLLYVGVTNNVERRLAAHRRDQQWWPQVTRYTVDWHATRSAALAAEKAAIESEHPVHNFQGADPSFAGRDRDSAHFAAKERNRRSREATQRRARLDAEERARNTARVTPEEKASIDAYVRRVVDAAPPLTPEQRDRLALLLRTDDA